MFYSDDAAELFALPFLFRLAGLVLRRQSESNYEVSIRKNVVLRES